MTRPLGGHGNRMAAARGLGLWSVLDRADAGVPERRRGLPPLQAVGDQAPRSVVGEQQTARRREQTAATTAAHKAVFPGERSRLVIDRDDRRSERSDVVLLASS